MLGLRAKVAGLDEVVLELDQLVRHMAFDRDSIEELFLWHPQEGKTVLIERHGHPLDGDFILITIRHNLTLNLAKAHKLLRNVHLAFYHSGRFVLSRQLTTNVVADTAYVRLELSFLSNPGIYTLEVIRQYD